MRCRCGAHSGRPLTGRSDMRSASIQIGSSEFLFLLPTGVVTQNVPPCPVRNQISIPPPRNVDMKGAAATAAASRPASAFASASASASASAAEGKRTAANGGVATQRADDRTRNATATDSTKPPYSYATLIAQAIMSTPSMKMSLNEIYRYVSARYPYYRMSDSGWQNSVRHNLSLNECFIKEKRPRNMPGKGALWMIDPIYRHLYVGSVFQWRRSTARTGSAGHALMRNEALPATSEIAASHLQTNIGPNVSTPSCFNAAEPLVPRAAGVNAAPASARPDTSERAAMTATLLTAGAASFAAHNVAPAEPAVSPPVTMTAATTKTTMTPSPTFGVGPAEAARATGSTAAPSLAIAAPAVLYDMPAPSAAEMNKDAQTPHG